MNTRLQSSLALRERIRQQAHTQSTALLAGQQTLIDWLNEHDRFRLWGSELAGWKALLAQHSDASAQLHQWQQLRENDTRKLDALALPTLTLSPQEVTAALAQHVQLRPLRQRLSNLHGQIAPKQKQLAQLRATLVQRQQELTQRNAVLAEKRQRYKDKNQQLADMRIICEQEARIKDLESQRALLQSGMPCPLCGSTTHPAIERYQTLELSVNQARREALEKEVKTPPMRVQRYAVSLRP